MPEYLARSKTKVVCSVHAGDDDEARERVIREIKRRKTFPDFLDWFINGMAITEKTPAVPEIRSGFSVRG